MPLAVPPPADLAARARDRGLARFAVPVVRTLPADLLTPVAAFLALRDGAEAPFLLESVEGGERVARYSFLGRNPVALVQARGRTTELRRGAGAFAPAEGTVFDVLSGLVDEWPEVAVPGLPRFTGGAVGFFGYDVVRLVEALPEAPPDPYDAPDAVWGVYRSVVAFDHVRQELVLVALALCTAPDDDERAFAEAEAELDALAGALRRGPDRSAADAPFRTGAERPSAFPQPAFEAAVEAAQRSIHEGDVFQLVVSRRVALAVEGGDPFQFYRALRRVNPSPYLFYLDFSGPADVVLVGASPEVLVRVEDGRATVLPIAGTRPRGATDAEDAAREAELVADAKEQAEHLMLVDLGRNDLGRVCETGSVEVARYAFVERYSHVMHLVSEVTGRVRAGVRPLDVFAATFPAGTLTGAPKVRAMQLLDRLEPERRGVYGGAVGYVDFRGNLDTCIAIRTAVVTKGTVLVQSGAGVVADSVPTAEYAETVAKAGALRAALALAAAPAASSSFPVATNVR